MNNKTCSCQSGCQAGNGFVPVSGGWDFNLDTGCQRQRTARCNAEENEHTCPRMRNNEPQAQPVCTGRQDCACDTCVRRRNAERNVCHQRKADNRGVGIVWARMQTLDEVYDAAHALKAGTLYPELNMPLNGYCLPGSGWPCGEDCGDKCQQTAFTLWELRLYLNTHPDDQEALRLMHHLQENCCEPDYATAFLEDIPCTDGTRNPAWRWILGPWPWEYEANCGC